MKKPEMTVVAVHEEVASNTSLVDLKGYDPYTNQHYEGSFNYSPGQLTPVKYSPSKGVEISTRYVQFAIAFLQEFEGQYRRK